MAKILVIDDDEVIRTMLMEIIETLHHNVAAAKTRSEAMAIIEKESYDLIFLDVMLPDGNGLEALPILKEQPNEAEVIIITGLGDAEGAELAIRSGAWDYLQKPFSVNEITLQIIRALEFRAKKVGPGKISLKRDTVIGISPELTFCLDQVAQCAISNSNVLLTGETGTGKELIARTIHENSLRAKNPFVVVDCAALPDTLIESILFGHKKGAFTGAEKDRLGLVKQADSGTLFLDEVGENCSRAFKSDFSGSFRNEDSDRSEAAGKRKVISV